MMDVITTLTGTIQIASWTMAVPEAIEKPSVPPPTKARHREP